MQERLRSDFRWLAWLCLSLTLWAAAAESTHHHANKTESTSCSICVVAHSAAPALRCNPARPVFNLLAFLQAEAVNAKAQFFACELGIRGPPAV
jgi:hypothetical protein